VGGIAEPGGVLHGAADGERHVQLGVDGDAGGADLAGVIGPPAVGHDSRRSGRRPEPRRHSGELGEPLGPVEPRPAGEHPLGLGEIHRRDVGRQHLDHVRIHPRFSVHWRGCRPDGGHENLGCSEDLGWGDAAHAGLERGHHRARDRDVVELQAGAPDEPGERRGHGHRPGEQRPPQPVGEAGSEVAPVGRRRQHEDVVVDEVGECVGPAGRRERPELDEPNLAGDPGQFVHTRRRPGEQRPAGTLGDGLVRARRKRPIANRDHGQHRRSG
jgi:hypothetical protein